MNRFRRFSVPVIEGLEVNRLEERLVAFQAFVPLASDLNHRTLAVDRGVQKVLDLDTMPLELRPFDSALDTKLNGLGELGSNHHIWQGIKDAWAAVAIALSLEVGIEADRAIRSLTDRAAFGDQCYQDRCENAYVEQTVMKKSVAEAASRCAEIAQEVIDGMDDPDFEFNSDIYTPIQFAIRREFGLESK
jgi:hypothetical protein